MNIEEYAAKYPKEKHGSLHAYSLYHIQELPSGSTILDIGCAEGNTVAFLSDLFPGKFNYVGVDLSQLRINIAREKNIKNVEFRLGDAMELPIDGLSVNFVLASQVIEHVTDDSKMLKEIGRVLVPEGLFQIDTVLKKTWAWYFYHSPAGWALDPTHLREYVDVEDLLNKLPSDLFVEKIDIVNVFRSINIIKMFSFLPDWMGFRIPGYYSLFVLGKKEYLD